MIKTFEDALKTLDTAINEIDSPPLKPLRPLIRAEMACGRSHIEGLAQAIERELRAHPVLFIGSAAAGALALGYLMSRTGERPT